MRRLVSAVLFLGCLPLVSGAEQPSPNKTPAENEPVAGYSRRVIQGFNVLVNHEVLEHENDARFKRKPIEVLELELRTIAQSLPERTVRMLRKLLIWVEWDDKTDPDAGRAIAKYYGVFGNRALWQLAKTKHPGKANNVEIINMRALTLEHQPGVKLERCVILHELVHAVHFRLFGPHNHVIRLAYAQAMNRHLYDQADDVYGRKVRPYARVSEAEYFAELSCAYLNKLHYYPFDREDLHEHDPVGYRLMVLVWGPPKKLEAVKKLDAEKAASLRLLRARNLSSTGKKDQALAVLRDLIETYPETRAAGEAKEMVGKLQAGTSTPVTPTP
jgi:hypothetical protein